MGLTMITPKYAESIHEYEQLVAVNHILPFFNRPLLLFENLKQQKARRRSKASPNHVIGLGTLLNVLARVSEWREML